MRTRRFLPLAGVVAILAVAACTDSPLKSDNPVSLGPVFVPQPGVCDTRAVSAAARDFFPQEYGKQARNLISALGDACAASLDSKATDEAFDVMALMEMALGGVSELDASAGASLATGLLPFMEFSNCEASGCVETGFADDVLLAISQRGAFGVRGGASDPADDVVSRDAVEPLVETDPPVWGVTHNSTWADVLGQRALVYGHPEAMVGGCDPSTADCPATNEQYSWNTLPDVDGFGAQMIAGACLVIDDLVVDENFLRMRRNATALENTAGFDACTAFLPVVQTASLAQRALQFLSPVPGVLFAGSKKTGPGGNASDFSDFTPLNADAEATLEIAMVADAVVGETIGPIYVTARTANGTPLERAQIVITPKDNNGSWSVDYLPGGTDSCGTDCRYTEEEGGTAVFEGFTLDKTGGYRICASVKADGDLGFSFPAEVCSNGLNVRPN